MVSTMLRTPTLESIRFTATLATLLLTACTKSASEPATQAQAAQTQTLPAPDSDLPEVVISSSRAHEMVTR